jgi:prepilin-type processing-associated H-X9-DG protein
MDLAAINCAATYDGKLPPGFGWFPGTGPGANGAQGGVLFHILPYMEQDALYKASLIAPGDKMWDGTTFTGAQTGPFPAYAPHWSNTIWNGSQSAPKSFICPSDPTTFSPQINTSYGSNGLVFQSTWLPTGNTSLRHRGGGTGIYPATMSDGTSNTQIFVELYASCPGNPGHGTGHTWPGDNVFYTTGGNGGTNGIVYGPAYSYFQVQPTAQTCDDDLPASGHSGGINVGMGDGSVRFVGQGVNPLTWWYTITPNGGEVIPSDW